MRSLCRDEDLSFSVCICILLYFARIVDESTFEDIRTVSCEAWEAIICVICFLLVCETFVFGLRARGSGDVFLEEV